MTASLESTENPTQASAHLWRDAQWPLTIGLVSVVAVAAFEALAVSTILPAVVRDLGGLTQYGWVFTAYALTNIIGLVISGALADRHGPALPFVLGGICFTAGLTVSGFAPTMLDVIAGRVIQGFGGGLLSAVAYVIVARGYQPSARPRMLAMLSSAWVVPGLIGPALASLIAARVGWRWAFLSLAILTPVAVLLTIPSLRRFARHEQLPWDWSRTRAAVLLALGTGLALLSSDLPGGPGAFIVLLVGLLLGGFALQRILPAGTMRVARGLPAIIAAMALLNIGFFGVDAFVPLALTAARGQTITFAGLVLTVTTLVWTTGAWVQARLLRWFTPALIARIGLGCVLAGILAMFAVLHPQLPLALAFLAWGCGGLGMGFAYTTLSLLILNNASAQREGEVSSALSLTGVLGLALGSGLGGACVAIAHARHLPIAAALSWQDLIMLSIIAATLWLTRRFTALIGK